jgi:regulatory protein
MFKKRDTNLQAERITAPKRVSSFAKPPAAQAGEITRSSDTKRSQPRDFTRTKPKQPAKMYASWLLSKREYSAKILRDKLIRRGYTPEEADEGMAFVQEYNFQSDERFAGQKARSMERRAGNTKVVMALRAKGIDQDLAKKQAAELGPEQERAIAAAEKFRGQIEEAGLSHELRAKVYRFLATRGFSSKSIEGAMKDLKSENR